MEYIVREGWISIEGRDGKMHDYKGLDFKFSGEKVGSVYGRFECAIGGLSADSVNEISAWNVAESVKRHRRVDVFAGYQLSGAEKIFSGYVFEAKPTSPPDIWVNIVCLPKLDFDDVIESKFHGDAVMLIESTCEELKLDHYRIDTKLQFDKPISFHYKGNRAGLIDAVAKCLGVKAYADENVLVVTDRRGWLGEVRNSRTISMQTGMIGIPKVDMRGAVVRVRVDDSYGICTWIYLDSKFFPKANGHYFVIKKKHQGHFRGNEWFTDLECIRAGAQV